MPIMPERKYQKLRQFKSMSPAKIVNTVSPTDINRHKLGKELINYNIASVLTPLQRKAVEHLILVKTMEKKLDKTRAATRDGRKHANSQFLSRHTIRANPDVDKLIHTTELEITEDKIREARMKWLNDNKTMTDEERTLAAIGRLAPGHTRGEKHRGGKKRRTYKR